MNPGVYTAIITPFTDQGNLDEEGLKENIRFQMANGIDGIVALGTTGEAPTLNAKEKEQVIRIARQECRKTFLVGTGNYSTDRTIEETQKAFDLGADIALVVTPYYNRPTQDGLFRHYAALAKEVKKPILIYNIQSRTGQNLTTETLQRLAEIPEIIGVKEASGSLIQMMDIIEQILPIRPDFKIFSGDDNLTLPLMAVGGHGVISVLSNLIPGEIKELVSYTLQNNYPAARECHYRLLPLIKGAFLETNPMPIKAMMSLADLPAGPCRLPLCPLTDENRKKIEKLIGAELLLSHG